MNAASVRKLLLGQAAFSRASRSTRPNRLVSVPRGRYDRQEQGRPLGRVQRAIEKERLAWKPEDLPDLDRELAAASWSDKHTSDIMMALSFAVSYPEELRLGRVKRNGGGGRIMSDLMRRVNAPDPDPSDINERGINAMLRGMSDRLRRGA